MPKLAEAEPRVARVGVQLRLAPRAYCWGTNKSGQLGNGSNNDSNVPVEVKALGSHVSEISAGANHTCAVVDGAAYCWGNNAAGQLGDGSMTNRPTPQLVSALALGVST